MDIVEVSGGTGLGMYTPTAAPYQTRVSFSWIDNPNTVQKISYVIGLQNTPASTLIMVVSNSAGPQLFALMGEEILQPVVPAELSDSDSSDWEQVT
jgi:hypothetical protein